MQITVPLQQVSYCIARWPDMKESMSGITVIPTHAVKANNFYLMTHENYQRNVLYHLSKNMESDWHSAQIVQQLDPRQVYIVKCDQQSDLFGNFEYFRGWAVEKSTPSYPPCRRPADVNILLKDIGKEISTSINSIRICADQFRYKFYMSLPCLVKNFCFFEYEQVCVAHKLSLEEMNNEKYVEVYCSNQTTLFSIARSIFG